MKKQTKKFKELDIGDVFFNEFGHFVKLSNLDESEKPIPNRISNSLNLDIGHYMVVPLEARVILEKSLKDYYPKEDTEC